MLAVHIAALLLFSLSLLSQSSNAQNINKPIHMDRREIGVLGEIVSELKGKAMGGRMRFGKRGLNYDVYDVQQERPNYGYVY